MMKDIFDFLFLNDYSDTEDFTKFLEDALTTVNDLFSIDTNSINDLYKAKKKIEDLISYYDKMIKNDDFRSYMKIIENICGENMLKSLNDSKEFFDKKIEEYKKVVDKSTKETNDNLTITKDTIKDCLSQKILVNKKSNEKTTDELCQIVAAYLNTSNPPLKNTKENYAKISAAANLLFGFADFTLHI